MRPISQYNKDSCKFIGIFQGFGFPFNGGYAGAMIDLRNKVAAAGGDSFAIVSQRSEQISQSTTYYYIDAEALVCRKAQQAPMISKEKGSKTDKWINGLYLKMN